jgi:hypothetical protein
MREWRNIKFLYERSQASSVKLRRESECLRAEMDRVRKESVALQVIAEGQVLRVEEL